MNVRLLTSADLDGVMLLSREAGWNQTREDWARMMALTPQSCFGIDCDGRVVATATAYCYGSELAWVGMVLTAADYRGRGFARATVQATLDFARSQDVAWIKLDATDMGRPLYEKLGFVAEYAVERWLRPPSPAAAATVEAYRPNPELDLEAFGADRSSLLASLAPIEAASAGGAFALGRPGSKAAYFGPCVSRNMDSTAKLLDWYLSRHAREQVFWDLVEPNPDAFALARTRGFAPVRRLMRMVLRGRAWAPPFVERPELVYALGGFEFG
ncbi:MAG: GNAT family N-acetyltransferase [Acidobacteriales bacterium]|nr:GNAT family N-acetyltransferase [Terriglobales bacterium]